MYHVETWFLCFQAHFIAFSGVQLALKVRSLYQLGTSSAVKGAALILDNRRGMSRAPLGGPWGVFGGVLPGGVRGGFGGRGGSG